MRRNRGILYAPKVCQHCQAEYVPTSGRQLFCERSDCKRECQRQRLERKRLLYQARVQRPTQKTCEWAGCSESFPVKSTGLIPTLCPTHRRVKIAPQAQAATAAWRARTLDQPCRFPGCENLQHPSARGWCHYHYPILSMHGVGADEWWGFYEQQGGRCPVCQGALSDGRVIAVDHDHTSAPQTRHDLEHVRGLLHAAPCNSVIVGGLETAIRNGWLPNVLRYIAYPLPESN
jgi:hypothetical protein